MYDAMVQKIAYFGSYFVNGTSIPDETQVVYCWGFIARIINH